MECKILLSKIYNRNIFWNCKRLLANTWLNTGSRNKFNFQSNGDIQVKLQNRTFKKDYSGCKITFKITQLHRGFHLILIYIFQNSLYVNKSKILTYLIFTQIRMI